MKQEDKILLRTFYQTMAGSGGIATPQQIDFYFKVLKGNANSRQEWIKANTQTLGIPANIQSLILNMDSLTKEDLVIIAGTQVGSFIAPKVQNVFQKIWNTLFGWIK